MRDLASYERNFQTVAAFKLQWLTLVRPNEALGAKWAEFNLDAAVWCIPAERMKMRQEHLVPLALLAETGVCTRDELSAHFLRLESNQGKNSDSVKRAFTPLGLVMFFLGPIATCALLIYFTRQTVITADRSQKRWLAGIKKGWFRLWVVCSLCWVAFAFNSYQIGHELQYAYRYYFDHASLTTENAESTCNNPFNDAAARVMMTDKPTTKSERQHHVGQFSNEKEILLLSGDENICNPHIMPGYGVYQPTATEVNQCLKNRADARATAEQARHDAQAQADIEAKKQIIQKCIREYRSPDPTWNWAALIILPPTLGVLAALLLLWSVFSVMRWVWIGFKQ